MVFVNGRRIMEFGLLQAMEYGAEGHFPNGTHPFGCLFVSIDPALVDFNIHPAKKEALEFVKAYEAKYGARNFFASLGWNALKIVEAAVPKALKVAKPGTEKFRVALRDAIEGTKGLKGAGTVFTMTKADHTGINQLGMCVLKVENGKWKLEDHAEFK